MQTQNAAAAAIQFALETDDGLTFLRCWNEGNFDAIRREWPEAPEAVFVGADQLLHVEVSGAVKVGANKDRTPGQWVQPEDIKELLQRPTLGKPKSNGLGVSGQL